MTRKARSGATAASAMKMIGSAKDLVVLRIADITPNNQRIGSYDQKGFDTLNATQQLRIKSLAKSIETTDGMSQLPEVVPLDGKGRFQCIAGDRRILAAWLLGAEAVQCTVPSRKEGRTDLRGLVENLQREPLTSFETAREVALLVDAKRASGESVTVTAIADGIGLSRSVVANLLRARSKLAPALMKRWEEEPRTFTATFVISIIGAETPGGPPRTQKEQLAFVAQGGASRPTRKTVRPERILRALEAGAKTVKSRKDLTAAEKRIYTRAYKELTKYIRSFA